MKRPMMTAAICCLTAAPVLAMDSEPDDAAPGEVTLINVFEVPEGKLDETIGMWIQARDFLQSQPGYISTALHQALGPDARFQLINIAQWESAGAFEAATAAMRETSGIKPVEGLTFVPGLYRAVLTD